MFFLIALLVVALGAGANYLAYGAIRAFGNPASVSSPKQNIANKGGFKIMDNNPWLRYALYSFLGILLLMVFVGLLAPNQQGMYGQGQMQMMPGMNGGNMQQMPYGNASFTGGMMVPVILVPVNMPMHNAMGQMGMQGGNMGMNQMPMGMQGGMGMMGQMPMNNMQGNMGQMPMGMQGGMGQMPMGMQGGMGQMPMGMQGGNMGNMQGGGMGMMNMSGGGTSGSSSSSGGMGGMM